MNELDLQAIRARADAATAGPWRADLERLRSELRDKRNDLLDVRGLLSPNGGESVLPEHMAHIGKRVAPAVERLIGEVRRLREHILDIDAHATPYGDIPDEPGYAGTYLLTAGALHRALGRIGHSAPCCQAEAERDAARAEVEQLRRVVDAATAWRAIITTWNGSDTGSPGVALINAVDAYNLRSAKPISAPTQQEPDPP